MDLLNEIYNNLLFEETIKGLNRYYHKPVDKNLLIESYEIFIYYFGTDRKDIDQQFTYNELMELALKFDSNAFHEIIYYSHKITYKVRPEYILELMSFYDKLFEFMIKYKQNDLFTLMINRNLNMLFELKDFHHFTAENKNTIIQYFINKTFTNNICYSWFNSDNVESKSVANSSKRSIIKNATEIFSMICELIKHDKNILDFIIKNNYFEQFCTNLSISNLQEIKNNNMFDEFTKEYINLVINNKQYEIINILKTDYKLSEEEIKLYMDKC